MTVQPTRDQLRALADRATPGPWVAGEPRGWGDNDDMAQSDIDTPAGTLTWDDHGGEVFKPADAAFIAAARQAVPALLDENAALRARIKAVEDVLRRGPYEDARGNAAVRADAIRRALDGEQ